MPFQIISLTFRSPLTFVVCTLGSGSLLLANKQCQGVVYGGGGGGTKSQKLDIRLKSLPPPST